MTCNCENLIIDNIKMFGWRYNSDGIDVLNCKNVQIKNSFLRCFDDCITLKGIPGWDEMSMENILVDNCILWCDWGRSLEIGAETCAERYENITFRNCDCLHGSFVVMDIQHCDRAKISNVVFEDIRVEITKDNQVPQLNPLDGSDYKAIFGNPELLCITFNDLVFYSEERVKGSVDGVVFRNISVITDEGWEMPPSSFTGYDDEHNIKNVVVENLTFNGKRLTTLEEAKFTIARKAEVILK